MLTDTMAPAPVSPDDPDWVPPWWGSDEANAKEAAEFANWTRKMRTE